MPFGTATVVTNAGVAIQAKRMVGATPTQPEPKYIAMGTGATGAARTAAVGDTALSTEYTAAARATGQGSTVTTTLTNDTYQCVGTITSVSGGTIAVDEAGLFDILTSSSGNLLISATFAVQNLGTGDGIQFTFKNQFVPG